MGDTGCVYLQGAVSGCNPTVQRGAGRAGWEGRAPRSSRHPHRGDTPLRRGDDLNIIVWLWFVYFSKLNENKN